MKTWIIREVLDDSTSYVKSYQMDAEEGLTWKYTEDRNCALEFYSKAEAQKVRNLMNEVDEGDGGVLEVVLCKGGK